MSLIRDVARTTVRGVRQANEPPWATCTSCSGGGCPNCHGTGTLITRAELRGPAFESARRERAEARLRGREKVIVQHGRVRVSTRLEDGELIMTYCASEQREDVEEALTAAILAHRKIHREVHHRGVEGR